jgi:hypothetical protein
VLTRGAAQRCRLMAAKAYRLLCAVLTTAVEEDKILRCEPDSQGFPQRLSRDHLVLELDEDEGGLGDVADLSRAERDALQGASALGHQSEAPFAQAAQRAQQRVAGPGIQVKLPAACWPLYRDMDAAACAFVPGVGQWPASPARATSTRPGGTAPTPRRPPRPAQLPPGQKTRPHRHPLPRPAHHQAGQPLQARHDQFRLSGIAPGPAAGRAER